MFDRGRLPWSKWRGRPVSILCRHLSYQGVLHKERKSFLLLWHRGKNVNRYIVRWSREGLLWYRSGYLFFLLYLFLFCPYANWLDRRGNIWWYHLSDRRRMCSCCKYPWHGTYCWILFYQGLLLEEEHGVLVRRSWSWYGLRWSPRHSRESLLRRRDRNKGFFNSLLITSTTTTTTSEDTKSVEFTKSSIVGDSSKSIQQAQAAIDEYSSATMKTKASMAVGILILVAPLIF